MEQRRPVAARPPWRGFPLNGRAGPVKESVDTAVAIEEFDRERMGIAAKE